MPVGLQTSTRRDPVANRDYGAPLGELGAELFVFFQASAQSVQAFGDDLAGKPGQIDGPLVHFDSGNDALLGEQFGKRRTIARLGANRLIEQNDTADRFLDALGTEEHLAVSTP